MKIVLLVPFFPPVDLNGSEIAAYNIAQGLARRGHEVHVITSLDKGLTRESVEEGFYLHRIEISRNWLLRTILYPLQCLPIIRKLNPDIVHAQGMFTAGLSALLGKKLLGKPYIAYGRGTEVYNPGIFTMRTAIGLVLKNANAVIALTQDMKRKIQEIWKRDAVVIPNGVDWERFSKLSRKEARQNLKIGDEESIVIFVGSVRQVKGVEYLIEAMNIIKQNNSKARLMVVGHIEEEGKGLKKQVAESDSARYVSFVGKVPVEMIPRYMAASDVFALPSISEGFPLVVLEAMASGLPIVATRVGGVPQVVGDGENGFLVEPRNPEQVAEKVCLLLEDNELRRNISARNRERAKQYEWQAVVESLEEVYKRVLTGN